MCLNIQYDGYRKKNGTKHGLICIYRSPLQRDARFFSEHYQRCHTGYLNETATGDKISLVAVTENT